VSEVSDPIFARIAARYDLINSVLSLGQERHWRSRGINMLGTGRVLDLGSGTGATDFEGRAVTGLDPVIEMLALRSVPARVVGLGEALPFADASFDGVFSGFVFRNLSSVEGTLSEITRTREPGAAEAVIDLTRPRRAALRVLHRMGTAIVLPLVGLLFAGAPKEYWYLHKSLDSLPAPEALFARSDLVVEEVWRMGVFGFVYGTKLRKPV